MHYNTQSNSIKIVILFGMLLCMVNNCFTLSELFLDNDVSSTYVDIESEETPESDTEDRSDTSEKEVEKDKVPETGYQIDFDGTILTTAAGQRVQGFFGMIHLELHTPPPEVV